MSTVKFESKETESREGGSVFRTIRTKEKRMIRVRIDGEDVRPIDFENATSVIAIAEGKDGVNVYFRGEFVPDDPLVVDSPLDWIWSLAYHLTVIMKRLHGDESETTYEDTKSTILTALLMPELMGDDEDKED